MPKAASFPRRWRRRSSSRQDPGSVGSRQHLLGELEVRPVEHQAVQAEVTRFWIGREDSDYRLGMPELLGAGCEYLVDRAYLVGMNRDLPRKSVAGRLLRLHTQSLGIAEVDEDRIDRLDVRSRGGQ